MNRNDEVEHGDENDEDDDKRRQIDSENSEQEAAILNFDRGL